MIIDLRFFIISLRVRQASILRPRIAATWQKAST